MFNLNDRVVYRGHGVALVNRKIKKIIAGKVSTFYELKFVNKDMTILVPIENKLSGIRTLSSQEKVNDLFKFLSEPSTKIISSENSANWKQRNKGYQEKLRSGDMKDISMIYRELKYIEQQKELSFCEKNLLAQTENLLAEEIALIKQYREEKAVECLRSVFNHNMFIGRNAITQKTI